MVKRINWKLIMALLTWAVCLSGLAFLMSFIAVKKDGERCLGIKILVPGTQSFVESGEVYRIIAGSQRKLKGELLANINMQQMETALKANPYIEDARIYADMDGMIWVRISQREPVLRIINSASQDFYIDKNGMKIPSSVNFTARVLVASGFIDEVFSGHVDTLQTQMAHDLLTVSQFIQKDSLWNDQIEQLYVNNRSEIEMIPLVGNQRIILGTADSLDVKFRNLLAFYKKAMPVAGWDAYRTINVKYAGQIVCERADSLSLKGLTVDSLALPDSLKQKNKITEPIKTVNH